MKNFAFLLSLLFLNFSFGQETKTETITETKKNNPKGYFTYGINFQAHDDFAINDKLGQVNLPEMRTFAPELFIGMTIFGKKYSGDLDFGFINSKKELSGNENRYQGFTTRLRVHYNVINKEKYAFTTGLNFSNTSGELTVFSKSNSIDLNDLTPDNNAGQLSIKNSLFYFGPSASLYLFKNKSTQIRINAGYEFAFTNGKWKSDYADVDNTVKENGNNRFVFGVTFL